MYGAALISFREGFEALLILVIVASYLRRTGRGVLVKHVLLGGGAAVLAGLLLGGLSYSVYEASVEKELVEAVGAFVAVPVLTSVIYWMAKKGPRIREELETRVEKLSVSGRTAAGFLALGFVVVVREAVETVLFVTPLLFRDPSGTIIGVFVGLAASSILAYAVFRAGMRINLRSFFYITSILLVFVASGILGYGVHEALEWAEEEGINVGILGAKAYSLPVPESSPLHEGNVLGSLLAVMLGYTTEMELARLVAQAGYLIVGLTLVVQAYKGHQL